jgi:hypothetical protein
MPTQTQLEADSAATYTEYQIERGTWEDPGVRMMPVAGPTPQFAQVVVLHAPIEYVWMAWIATRIGAPCVMPDPYAVSVADPNLRYLGGKVSAIVPHPTGNGVHEFQQAGIYWFGKTYVTGLNSPMNLGKMPWEDYLAASANRLPKTLFSSDMLCTDAVPRPGGPDDPNNLLSSILTDPLANIPST